MSAVISNSDPMTYLREHADMEHDTVRTVAQADAVAAVDPLNRIDELLNKILRERAVLRHEREEISALMDNAKHREAVIGDLQAQLDAEVEKIRQAARS
jgi:seryl-tRNA synthetase